MSEVGLNNRQLNNILKLIIAALILVIGGMIQQHEARGPNGVTIPPGYYKVEDFADGDTIKVDMSGKTETVRFIGVDTPETHDPRKAVQCFGIKAAEYTKTTIGDSPVRLEADPLNTNRDRYDRLLRYVYLQDGRLINAEIIKSGYGFAYTSFPFSKLEEFKAYQKEAMEGNKGLWSECTPSSNEYGGFTSNDAP